MTKKEYGSSSTVAFSVMLCGKEKRISFISLTGGGSYYMSADEAEQSAIEKHPWFGKKFELKSVSESKEAKKDVVAAQDNDAVTEKPVEEKPENTVHFSNAADAKRWLMDEYEATSYQTQSKAKMIEFAQRKGIELVIG